MRTRAIQVILLKDNVIQRRLERRKILFSSTEQGSRLRCQRNGDTLHRADIRSPPELHSAIFDHDVGLYDWIGSFEACRFKRESKNRSIRRVNRDLPVVG